MSPSRRFVVVVRADPVICGHSGEARNLAEAALDRGFDDVRIVTWPLDLLERSGLPLKPLDTVMPYSPGIVVERPGPVGDYKVPDGRWVAGLTGRLVELFTDGVPTVAMSLYLSPHATALADAVRVARASGLPVDVTTVAEAVGSDVTNVVRACVAEDRFGAAAQILAAYLDHDVCLAVSAYTREIVVGEAEAIDAKHGTRFAPQVRERVQVSHPAIDVRSWLDRDPATTASALAARGLRAGGYVLYLSRLARAKGVDDLIEGYARSSLPRAGVRLVIAGNGPQADDLHAQAAATGLGDLIAFLSDVGDDEKPHLMAASIAFALPSKPRPEFTETFGIALAESLLAGGGPVITTGTGGIGEAVGDSALVVPPGDPGAIAAALDDVTAMPAEHRAALAARGRQHALTLDRATIFDGILRHVAATRGERPGGQAR